MSKTLSLSRTYGSFFWGCTKFAVSPYTHTFLAVAGTGAQDKAEDCLANVAAATAVCGILTFIVPILPALSSITCTIASIAMLLATASMFVTYPFALIADGCNPSDSPWSLDDYTINAPAF